ncbi:MAG TPA: DUF2207 domain-containing protein, partial [Abditibacteriaceae bacterium]|nr:DUF2207 domain-containing protein [Abditibacteriaceae bacterium]
MQFSLRPLRPALLLLIAGVLTVLWQAMPARAEIIRSFDVQCRLQPDTTLDVTETIQMDFESAQRHGIYR